jgi:hypothetical protein
MTKKDPKAEKLIDYGTALIEMTQAVMLLNTQTNVVISKDK